MKIDNPDAKAWTALIIAILVIVENYLGLKIGPVGSNGITDILGVVGAGIAWLLPRPTRLIGPSGGT